MKTYDFSVLTFMHTAVLTMLACKRVLRSEQQVFSQGIHSLVSHTVCE